MDDYGVFCDDNQTLINKLIRLRYTVDKPPTNTSVAFNVLNRHFRPASVQSYFLSYLEIILFASHRIIINKMGIIDRGIIAI